MIEISHLTELDRRAYAIADNKIALNAGWNDELLQVELEALKTKGIDLSLLGFSDEELKELADQLRPELSFENEDSAPAAAAMAVTRANDIWLMGEHRLICGDALDEQVYQELLGNEIADAGLWNTRITSPTNRVVHPTASPTTIWARTFPRF